MRLSARSRTRTWVGEHHAVVRRHFDRFRGREMNTAGDGFFATFDGPLRAIRCADAVTRARARVAEEPKDDAGAAITLASDVM